MQSCRISGERDLVLLMVPARIAAISEPDVQVTNRQARLSSVKVDYLCRKKQGNLIAQHLQSIPGPHFLEMIALCRLAEDGIDSMARGGGQMPSVGRGKLRAEQCLKTDTFRRRLGGDIR